MTAVSWPQPWSQIRVDAMAHGLKLLPGGTAAAQGLNAPDQE
ncbi:MAG TPA: hypothetical protein VF814_08035 [Casimicrobiaceae bacterium]